MAGYQLGASAQDLAKSVKKRPDDLAVILRPGILYSCLRLLDVDWKLYLYVSVKITSTQSGRCQITASVLYLVCRIFVMAAAKLSTFGERLEGGVRRLCFC